jgi:ABC-type Fe3+ transport system substrate-binding protein
MLRIAQGIALAYLLLALVLVGLQFRPAPTPVVVDIVYGTEKEEWLEDAAARFEATSPTVNGRPIDIVLEGAGSREMALRVAVEGDLKPTVISPASSIHTELLRGEWQQRYGENILFEGADAPQQLVITPLVVVTWEERASALSLDDPATLWQNLHQLLASDQGWGAFGHPEWGLARWGHTNPETSNSGIQTIVLLAYAYHEKSSGLTTENILASDFQQWFDDFERAVPEFPSSTGFLMENMLQFGPSKYSFIVVYENLAIANIETARGRGGAIRVYYPPANILSDHPYAILNAEWVSPQQREAAALFREFLLSEEIQQLALQFGFRPANVNVPLNQPGNPFEQYAESGIQMDIVQSVEVPSADVINELIDLWRRGDYD